MPWTTPKTWTVGEVVTAANMNAQVRDNFAYIGQSTWVVKTAAQSVVSSTALVNDTHLLFPLTASTLQYWAFEMFLVVTSNTTADFKCAFTWPTNWGATWAPSFYDATLGGYWVGGTSSLAAAQALITSDNPIVLGCSGAGQNLFAAAGIVYDAAGTGSAGNFQFRIAQNGASGTTTVEKGSWMRMTKVL
jgi:hypothetical protein